MLLRTSMLVKALPLDGPVKGRAMYQPDDPKEPLPTLCALTTSACCSC